MVDISPNLAPTDLSQSEFKTGYWVYQHHDIFKKILVWFLVIIIVGFWGYASVKFISYLATTKAHDQMLESLTGNITDTSLIHEKNRAQDLEVISVMAVPTGTNYDLVAFVRNPNLQWAVNEVRFSFMAGGEKKGSGEDFVMPLGEKYIYIPNIDLTSGGTNLSLVLDGVDWRRIKNFKDFPITEFVVSNQQLENLTDAESGTAGGVRLNFDLKNNSAFSFWEVPVMVILKSGAGVAGVATRVVDGLDSGQAKALTFFWNSNLANVTNVEVQASVNVLDEAVFKPL